MSQRDGVATAFREAAGRAPEGVWSAPGRVNVIGEHTDYNEGYVLPFAIDRRTAVAAARRDDGRLVVRSAQRPGEEAAVAAADLAPHTGAEWARYVLGVVWALRTAGHDVGGLDLLVDGAVPVGAGLSSSAALECAVAVAAADLYELAVPADELARVAQRAENDFVGMPCGLMDQIAAMTCTAGHVLFFDARSGSGEQVPFDPGAAGLAMLVIDTRAHHELADGEYAKRRASCEEAARRLGVAALRDVAPDQLDAALARLGDGELARRTRHVVTENARVLDTVELLRAGRLPDIGRLLTASHESLRDDFEVSAPELDAAVEAAVAAGALGARMTGGGFGGSAIALVPADGVQRVAAAVATAFEERHYSTPQVWPAVPSPGAGRDDGDAGQPGQDRGPARADRQDGGPVTVTEVARPWRR